jgi:hypothetical protein
MTVGGRATSGTPTPNPVFRVSGVLVPLWNFLLEPDREPRQSPTACPRLARPAVPQARCLVAVKKQLLVLGADYRSLPNRRRVGTLKR